MTAHAPKLDSAEEAALLEKIQKGTQSERDTAFERVFAALREPVYALCLRLTGNTVDAEDALQEVFIAAFRGLSAFRGDARISTWLYRIAVREALRQKSRHSSKGMGTDADVPAQETNPAVHKERVELFYRALDGLSADHRTILAMFAVQGLSHGEIAEVLKIPTGTVWSRLHEARKKLAEEMGELEQQLGTALPSQRGKKVTRPRERKRSGPIAGMFFLLCRVLSLRRFVRSTAITSSPLALDARLRWL